jgi:hypothetical protein
MGITSSLNSKANVKRSTQNDLPFSPAQPVINSFYGTSTAGQTVINLGFTIQAATNGSNVAFTDIFFLFVDGKKLNLGASNDYTFTSIGSDGTSSQVTLNFALPVNLNIQAFKLGLKAEIAFGTDNRFVQLYEAQGNGFQAFVNQTTLMSPTTTAGTPAAGTFYSTITNRAQMVDLTQDLKPRMGIERIMTLQSAPLQNEFGHNGELVFALVNDTLGQVRFVGSGWQGFNNLNGVKQLSFNQNDYVEITFYGTGLNLLTAFPQAGLDIRVSVDGGTESGNIVATGSSVLAQRNYGANQIVQAASGLSAGVHTVKLRNNATTTEIDVFGFEILNVNSSPTNVSVTPGVSYLQGKKYTSSALQSFAYNSVATGTRGGRVLVYQNGDGTIGQSFQAVNSSAAVLTSSDHTNEEIARTYSWREFGSGRTDDFSGNFAASANLAFTLDDGTTSLVGSSVSTTSEGLGPATSGGFISFTFVGTGLDLERTDDATGGSDNYTYSIDGGTATTFATSGLATRRITKIVSGLPYGTHTFRLSRVTATTFTPRIYKFIVYQPKKPALSVGSIELADYNVMANYVANATASVQNIGTGTLRKSIAREMVYSGTWAISAVAPTEISGFSVNSSTTGDSIQFTFFGTGFEHRFSTDGGASSTWQYTVDGVTGLSGATTSSYGAVVSSFSAGVISLAATASNSNGVTVNGLTLGNHVIKLTKTAGTGNFYNTAVDLITTIHSAKSNIYADLQNTLSVGSQGISDNRKLTPVKDILPVQKAFAQAIGVAGAATVSATSFVPMPDMSCALKTGASLIQIVFDGSIYQTSGTPAISSVFNQIYVDGVAVGQPLQATQTSPNGMAVTMTNTITVPVSPGFHKVDVYFRVDSGTWTLAGPTRVLSVKEL